MTDVAAIPPIRRGEGLRLSRIEYVRLADVLESLRAEEWAAPTDCPGWDVKAVASHVLGLLTAIRRPTEFVRQYAAARRLGYDDWVDGLNAVQVRDHAAWEPARIVRTLRDTVDPALRMRSRTPWVLRRFPLRFPVSGRVPLGWVNDVIYTRDTFLHRVDVCRATGREVVVDEAEQRVVADIVKEWAGRHGAPFVLRLTGPAGGEYAAGSGGERIECDAVEFARLVSGRGAPAGLLATPVQF